MVWKRNEVMKQENRLDSDESRRFFDGAGNGNRTTVVLFDKIKNKPF